jgi:hypothetical protein
MTTGINVLGLFCEDIREEKNDVLTLIGLLPDNINLAAPPSSSPPEKATKVLPKICVYLRINFGCEYKFESAIIRLGMPKGPPIQLGTIDAAIIEKARTQAIESESPLAGVLFRVEMGGLRMPDAGIIRLEAEIDGETHLAAMLNIRLAEPNPTASPPPSLQ